MDLTTDVLLFGTETVSDEVNASICAEVYETPSDSLSKNQKYVDSVDTVK